MATINDIIPFTLNKELAHSKGITSTIELDENYFNLQSIYKEHLEKYLFEALNLKQYEEKITSNNFEFVEIDKGKQDPYQKFSSLDLKYIYLRNNIHIEKLNTEDLEILKGNNIDLISEMVKRTYKDVITINYSNVNTSYGPVTPNYFAPMNAIVFIIRYKSNDNELDESKYFKGVGEKKKYIDDLIIEMEKEIYTKLDMPTKIIQIII
jgi:hypothetical protein